MFAEDPLDADARRRLEALAQAIAYHAGEVGTKRATPDKVVETAVVFDQWIEEGKPEQEESEESAE